MKMNDFKIGDEVIDPGGDRGTLETEVPNHAGELQVRYCSSYGQPGYVFRGFVKQENLRKTPPRAASPSTDQKPRGEKAPLALLPWDVIAACCLAPTFLQKLHDDIGLLPIDRPPLPAVPKERTTDFLSELIDRGVDLGDVARVFAYGSTKYAPDNWRSFAWDEASRVEYWSAFLRHVLADTRGEKNDPESGLSHLAHAVCCLLIVAYHEAKS